MLMKKSYSEDELINIIKKRKNIILRRTIVLVLFFLGINVYAWFIYISKVGFNLNATVSDWNIEFYNGDTEVRDLNLYVNMYPNMQTFSDHINVRNITENRCDFEYYVKSFKLLGFDKLDTSMTDQQFINSLNQYPFKITFNATKNHLEGNERLDFYIYVNWSYESANEYYKLNDFFTYDPSLEYYNLVNGEYILNNNVTSSNYGGLKNDLYVQKDDADSVYGQLCGEYQKNTGKSCLEMDVDLRVTQSSSST